jgi:hypothetical protein
MGYWEGKSLGGLKMSQQMMVEALKKNPCSTPARIGVLQRKCDKCGTKDDEQKRGILQRSAVRESPEHVPPVVHEVLRSHGAPLDAGTRAFIEPHFGHDFSQVRVQTEPETRGSRQGANEPVHPARTPIILGEGPATKGAARQAECGKKCGGGELGSVECKLDEKSGLPTDKVQKEIREKDPCTRPCVDTHEEVHVKDFAPICRQVHQCLREARGDTKKTDKCLDTYEADSLAKIAGAEGTECNAYRAEKECMTKREPVMECKTKEGRSRWTAHLARTKCYEECYCRK